MSGWGTCPSDRQLLLTEQLFVQSQEMFKALSKQRSRAVVRRSQGPVCWAPWSMTYGMHWIGSLAAFWKQDWESSRPMCIYRFIWDPGNGMEGVDLPHRQRTKSSMEKWGLANSAACKCREPEQTADYIINTCLLYRPPSEAGLFQVGPETRARCSWMRYMREARRDDAMRVNIYFIFVVYYNVHCTVCGHRNDL